MPRNRWKQALLGGAFSFAGLLGGATAHAQLCAPLAPQEQARVTAIFDGDTIKLQDGRRVRFPGINAPEVAKPHQPGQPYGEAALRRLRQLISASPRVGLSYGVQRQDHYGRVLAYVSADDGRDLQRILLQEGLAAAIAIPPNIANAECYLQDEQAARSAHRGMWSDAAYQPLRAADITPKLRGFVFVQGRVQRVGKSRKSVWLNLDRQLALRIARDDMAYFTAYRPDELRGRTVIARGWLSRYKDQAVLRIRHPVALQVLPP